MRTEGKEGLGLEVQEEKAEAVKWVYAIAAIFLFGVYHADMVYSSEQPPYSVSDPAVMDDFREIFLEMSNHRHSNDDSSRPYHLLPDSSTVYDLGSSSAIWRDLYITNIRWNDGTLLTSTGSGGGGGGSTTGNSTNTIRISYGGSVLLSTNGVCPLPGACFGTGSSTINVVDIQAMILQNSTVGFTSFQIVESSGGINALPVLPNRFPLIIVTTALANTQSGWSSPITTGVVIPSGYWIGVQVSTTPERGTLPLGMNIFINAWKKQYGGN